jgi:hypothetical protein
LAFLVILGAACVGGLYAAQQETKQRQVEVIQRVAVLETQYKSIMDSLDKLNKSTEKLVDKMDSHLMKGEKEDPGPKGKNFWGKYAPDRSLDRRR